MSDGLEIRLLGPPEVFQGGKPVKFAARKALALFAYLAVEPGAHPREKLQGIFWPESEPHKAQSALRSTLARIKDALRGVDDLLKIEGDRIGFNASRASFLDLNLVAQATGDTQPTQLAPPTVALLQNAVEAARGPFLEAFSLPDTPAFNDWVIIQRNMLEPDPRPIIKSSTRNAPDPTRHRDRQSLVDSGSRERKSIPTPYAFAISER